MNYTTYKNWHIYAEPMGAVFTHAFFHDDFAANNKQGVANSLEEAKQKIDQLEQKS